MNNRQANRQLERERALYLYACALDRGDFDAVANLLSEAERDPELERMIIEINQARLLEEGAATELGDAELVRQLVHKHIPSGVPTDEEIELPPLTVAHVVNRLQDDPELWQQAGQEDPSAIERLRHSDELLPESLNQRGMRQFFGRLRISVSERFQEMFRETAIFLSMGREQGLARMAARRRQKQARKQSPRNTEEKK